MKKQILAGLLLLCCGVTMLGCSSNENKTNDTQPVSENTETGTITEAVEPTILLGGAVFHPSDDAENGVFSIKKTMTLNSDDSRDPFNRMTLHYSADEPLMMTAVYKDANGKEIEDILYLEAGENQTFSFLITDYLEGAQASGIVSLSFDSCSGKRAELTLSGLETELRPVLDKSIYTISGSRYDVGIKLAWGGGICSIIDHENPVSGVGNLVNQCDTGRLIQQSYYGTGANGEYTPGTYNGSTWAYNPVQGGNQYNQPSRLIDVIESNGAVYIKCQPADWSNKDYLTPSYMENTYTVLDDRIVVDNRFMDFSGWDHGCSTQEIPAFYTLSYFGTFIHYTGEADWTGDVLSYEKGLKFWGDSKYHDDCDFRINAGQTETWCAWVSEKDDYGIGLYVPNCDSLLAGRFSFNGSKDPYDGATNYVAPVNRFRIDGFQPVAYSYLITTGSVAGIRSVFSDNRDFTDNASLKENFISMRSFRADYADLKFDTPEMTGAFSTFINSTEISYSAEEKAAVLTCTGGDPYAGINYGSNAETLSADTYKTVSITYMMPEDNSDSEYTCELFLCAGATAGPTAGISKVYDGLIADGEWHTADIDLSDLDFWTGDIHLIRFDYFNSAAEDDCIFVKEIKLK